MRAIVELVVSVRQSDEGVTSLEYALIASLIALVIVAAVQALGNELPGPLVTLANAI